MRTSNVTFSFILKDTLVGFLLSYITMYSSLESINGCFTSYSQPLKPAKNLPYRCTNCCFPEMREGRYGVLLLRSYSHVVIHAGMKFNITFLMEVIPHISNILPNLPLLRWRDWHSSRQTDYSTELWYVVLHFCEPFIRTFHCSLTGNIADKYARLLMQINKLTQHQWLSQNKVHW
jgi:hypothetical protein